MIKYTIQKCKCRFEGCKDHSITQFGMVQGGMFKSKEEAEDIANKLNSHNDLVMALISTVRALKYTRSNKNKISNVFWEMDVNSAIDLAEKAFAKSCGDQS